MADTLTFPYEFDKRWTGLYASLLLRPNQGVSITGDGKFRASYGLAKIETPLENIDHTQITGPHRWYTAVGLRLSLADDGITFGTNHRRGLCIQFKDRIPAVIGPRKHSTLWVSVADCEGLAAAIGR